MKNHNRGGVKKMRNLKLLGVAGVIIFLFVAGSLGNVFACVGDKCITDSNVQDSNDGNKGYIFVYDCEKGNDSVGEWVDPTTITTLKGDKGDTGEQWIQGIQGNPGVAGQDGLNGLNGQDGINGIDGLNGEQGIQGFTGDKGDTGEQGIQGLIGEQGIQGLIGNTGNTGEQGIQGVQGVQGKTGVKGDKGDRGLRGKGLKNQQKAGIELRVFDTKRTTFSIYMNNDFNNKVTETGIKLTIKLGTSYEEREIAKTNRRLDRLEATIGTSPIIERVVDSKGKVKSISISANGLAVNGNF